MRVLKQSLRETRAMMNHRAMLAQPMAHTAAEAKQGALLPGFKSKGRTGGAVKQPLRPHPTTRTAAAGRKGAWGSSEAALHGSQVRYPVLSSRAWLSTAALELPGWTGTPSALWPYTVPVGIGPGGGGVGAGGGGGGGGGWGGGGGPHDIRWSPCLRGCTATALGDGHAGTNPRCVSDAAPVVAAAIHQSTASTQMSTSQAGMWRLRPEHTCKGVGVVAGGERVGVGRQEAP